MTTVPETLATDPKRVSTRGKTLLELWRWRADRCDAIPPVQPPLDRFGALPLL